MESKVGDLLLPNCFLEILSMLQATDKPCLEKRKKEIPSMQECPFPMYSCQNQMCSDLFGLFLLM